MDAKIDTRDFDAAIERLREESPKLLGQIIRDEGGLLAQQVARYTPPKTMGQGKRAVARDIAKVFVPASKAYKAMQARDIGQAKAFWKAIKQGRHEDAQHIVRRSGVLPSNIQVLDLVDPQLHKKVRNRRGRVSDRYPLAIIGSGQSLSGYIKSKQANVGFAKSPWAKEAQALGKRVPAWMLKHAGEGTDILQDGTKRPLTPFLVLGSRVRYADSNELIRIVNDALDKRAKNIEKKLDLAIERRARKT